MKHQCLVCPLICLFLPMVASCENAEPRPLVIKAIKAHGGEQNLRRPRKGSLKTTSKLDGFDVIQDEFFDLPKRWKRITIGTINGERRVSFNLCVDDTMWEWEEGGAVQQTKNKKGAMPYFGVVTSLLDLASDNVKLSPLRNKQINGQSSNGVSASGDGGTGDYYFDSATGLLVEMNFKWSPEPGKEVSTRTIFGEFKEVDGVKLAYRRTICIKRKDSKDFVLLIDMVINEVRILETLPSDTFSRPEKK